MNIIGIDPGKSGAYAVVDSNEKLLFYSTFINFKEVNSFFKYHITQNAPLRVGFEDVASAPANGPVSTFSFGQNVGGWKALMEIYEINWVSCYVQSWQPKILGKFPKGESKKASVEYAATLYPEMRVIKNKKLLEGVADAICIALYAKRFSLLIT